MLVFVFILFNLTSIRAMLILMSVFMLFNLTSMRAMLIIVSKIVMIYAPPLGATVVLKGRGRGCACATTWCSVTVSEGDSVPD
jgi:hypothetical protein